jgi:hypothetical protein
MEELVDDDGYPTEYALGRIANWEICNVQDFVNLMKFIKSIWYYPECITNDENNAHTLITLGWSGNEDIIEAMENNVTLQFFYWYSSERGGKYVYAPMNYMGKDD